MGGARRASRSSGRVGTCDADARILHATILKSISSDDSVGYN